MTPSSEIEYEVRCPRDGVLRGTSNSLREAQKIAAGRDKECGKCYKSHGPHVVLRRWVTLWEIAPTEVSQRLTYVGGARCPFCGQPEHSGLCL